MNILIELNHPAHFHLFRNFAGIMKKKGNRIGFVVKQKDVLLDLLKPIENEYEIYVRSFKDKKSGFGRNILWILESDFKTLFFALKFKPDFLIGSNFSIAHIGRLLGKPSFLFAEDDAAVIPLLAKITYPFVTGIVAPACCNNGKWEEKSIKYESYHELAYLHTNYFKPDYNRVKNIFGPGKNYLIRFSGLTAHHDKNIAGLKGDFARKIIEKLSARGNVFITSEKKLEKEFEPYRISLDPSDMHHALYYADMLICDSQTMTAEAAVLGTPSLRFNGFVGRIGYLEELEHRYDLTYGIKTSEPDKLLLKLDDLLDRQGIKEEWEKKRLKMLSEKIDLTALMIWFFENYPQSREKISQNQHFQYRFK